MKFAAHLKIVKPIALALALAASASFAHATIIQYNLTGVTTPDGALTGYVDINTATDEVTVAHITLMDATYGDPLYATVGGVATYQGLGNADVTGGVTVQASSGGQIELYYDIANIGTGNLAICNGACGNGSNETSYVQVYNHLQDDFGGSLDPNVSASAPEPSSLVLLGTGILGIAGAARRKFLNA